MYMHIYGYGTAPQGYIVQWKKKVIKYHVEPLKQIIHVKKKKKKTTM